MKRIPKPVFFIVAILILAFAATAILGVKYYDGDIQKTVIKGISDIRWGIDIRGGVEATFKPDEVKSADSDGSATADSEDADDSDNAQITDEQIDSAKSIIETRMVSRGITDYEIYSDYNNKRIIVRFLVAGALFVKPRPQNADPVITVHGGGNLRLNVVKRQRHYSIPVRRCIRFSSM